MMSQIPKKIQVLNVPKAIPVPRMLNKLTIHFQKPSNGGGEVLDVEYPTSVNNVAYIVFTKEKDANNVLKQEHVLQIEKKTYKLEVREVEKGLHNADSEQVIQFVTTALDTRHFPKEKALQLIFRHDLEIVHSSGCIVEVKGSFPSLRKLRSDLMDLIHHSSPQQVTNLTHLAKAKGLNKDERSFKSGSFRNYRQANDSGSSSNSSTNSDEDDNSADQYASNIQSRSSMSRIHSGKSKSSPLPLVSSPSSLPVTSSNSLQAKSPHTHRSTWRLQKTVGQSSAEKNKSSLNEYSPHSSDRFSFPPTLSFTVDKLVFDYLEVFGTQEFNHLLEMCFINIKTVYPGDLYEMLLCPRRASTNYREMLSQTKSAICEHIENTQQQLRVHQVDLTMKKPCKQEILKRCHSVPWDSVKVLLVTSDQTISLVGPSSESFLVLQYILGKSPMFFPTGSSGPCQRGRRLNRTERPKRNSSCPPTGKEDPLDDSNANHQTIKNANQTQAQTTDQTKVLPRKPSPGSTNRKRRSLSESRKTTNKQRSPIDFGVQETQTKVGRSVESQRMQDNKQSKFPGTRQSLTPNFGIFSCKNKKRGQ
ncbi:uncharacterized protein LOC119972346 isoform X2 [Scyliorhinus canicula]|nr:uncharacterized protein LOC119972346 isoform X2 [Scyliorhinus canicula]XP_038664814.1 uncharacterized protein LOC119972346 isoform X2 [Scyliorhinus canicula]XP_038664815.1 uncharacterized protein LOC119972346 isoform X2 [Scyliorhinus canicula]